MKHSSLRTLLALACLGWPAAVLAAAPEAPARPMRGCGTPDPTPVERSTSRHAVERFRQEFGSPAVGGTIQVAFHVITNKHEGHVTQKQIEDQIRVLNRDFAGTGYRFVLASVDRTESNKFFGMLPGTGREKDAKQTLVIDPAHRLNIYSCGMGQNLLGWAYFPQSIPEDHWLHGVVIHYGTLPGGNLQHYNLGKSATHEVGHYLGLYHTFQGGCDEPGDEVEDTPFEAIPNFTCVDSRNTCPQPGDDPIENYMDYSDDACLTTFTSGQDARMDAIVPVYRPSLLDAAAAQSSRAPEIDPAASLPVATSREVEYRGAAPNPFRNETAIRFALPRADRVELKVYNVAGQLVETLVDGVLPAGEHGVMMRGRTLPSGMYFTRLRVGTREYARSIVLVR